MTPTQVVVGIDKAGVLHVQGQTLAPGALAAYLRAQVARQAGITQAGIAAQSP